MKRLPIVLVIICAAALGLGWGFQLFQRSPKLPADRVLAGHADIGGPFALEDEEGRVVTLDDFKGKYLFVYFGYTFCPDICPAALQNITTAFQKLPPQIRGRIQPIFITVDPERDTPETLQAFRREFPLFRMLRGSAAQIEAVKKSYKVYAVKHFHQNDPVDPYYIIDHSSLIYLMDGAGRYITHAHHDTPTTELKEMLIRHVTA